MQFQLEVIVSHVQTKPTAKGSYQQCELTYKRLDTGKIESKKVVSFTNKEIFNAASSAAQGSQWTVTAEKGEQYWEWKSMEQLAPGAASSQVKTAGGSATTATRSTYETPEERAKKQVYIVKQSSLSNAIETLSVGAKTPPAAEQVIALAQQYVDWVFNTDVKPHDPEADDVPY